MEPVAGFDSSLYLIVNNVLTWLLRDWDQYHQIAGDISLAGQPGVVSQVLGILEHINLILGRLLEAFKPLPNDNMAGGAGAITAAIVVNLDVIFEGDIKDWCPQRRFDFDIGWQETNFWHGCLPLCVSGKKTNNQFVFTQLRFSKPGFLIPPFTCLR